MPPAQFTGRGLAGDSSGRLALASLCPGVVSPSGKGLLDPLAWTSRPRMDERCQEKITALCRQSLHSAFLCYLFLELTELC